MYTFIGSSAKNGFNATNQLFNFGNNADRTLLPTYL